MVRSLMAVLVLTIFPGLAFGQEPVQQASRIHVVVDGDHLWGLAQFYYDDPFEWRIIYDANLGVVEDPHWIFPEEELVIPGIPGPAVAVADVPPPAVDPEPEVIAGADSVVVDVDREAPDLARPEPAIVGDVAVGPPTEVDAPPPLSRSRPNVERERRSRFYPTATAVVQVVEAADGLWVARSATWSAEWLGAASLEEVEFDGRIDSFVVEDELRTALPYTRVRLELEPGFSVRLGDALQIFRPVRVNLEFGVVLRPTGMMTVTRVAPNTIEGLVLEAYERVQVGQFVRPAPAFDLNPGEYPEVVTSRAGATVIEFGARHAIHGLREVTILDKGSRDGVAIGDEYVAFSGDGSTEEIIGRLRVVLTGEETSSAHIVTVGGSVFHVGTAVRLDRKMR